MMSIQHLDIIDICCPQNKTMRSWYPTYVKLCNMNSIKLLHYVTSVTVAVLIISLLSIYESLYVTHTVWKWSKTDHEQSFWCQHSNYVTAGAAIGAVQKLGPCTFNGIWVLAWFQNVALTKSEDRANYINQCLTFPGGPESVCVRTSMLNRTQWRQCASVCCVCHVQYVRRVWETVKRKSHIKIKSNSADSISCSSDVWHDHEQISKL